MRLYPNGAQKNGIVSMYLYYDGVVGREMDLEGPGLEVGGIVSFIWFLGGGEGLNVNGGWE